MENAMSSCVPIRPCMSAGSAPHGAATPLDAIKEQLAVLTELLGIAGILVVAVALALVARGAQAFP